MNLQTKYHEPVLVKEIIDGLGIGKNAHLNNRLKIIDATCGTGGHSLEIAKLGVDLLGIEIDPEILKICRQRLIDFRNVKLVNGNFKNIKKIAESERHLPVYAILFDLGISNLHFNDNIRGFSFRNETAMLDMRLDPQSTIKASDLLRILRFDQLIDLFTPVLGNGDSKKLSQRIIQNRGINPIETVGDLLKLCESIGEKKRLHSGTLALLALRIAVNSELDNLKTALPDAFGLLMPGGRLLIISFHSLEDRIVKDFFAEQELSGNGIVMTKKPIMSQIGEVQQNVKARSAKLRILIKK